MTRAVVVLVLLALTACSTPLEDEEAGPPASSAPSVTSDPPTGTPSQSPAPTPSPRCAFPSGETEPRGTGFLVRWNITSGVPSPAWNLTEAQGAALLALVGARSQRAAKGPSDQLGDYLVTASGRTVATLRREGLPAEFWIRGQRGPISEFLASTLPCRQS